ncbi:CPBP family glutamic-type intramembrane protease [Saccharomonospora sp. NPDC046836]|uniref:CPBP family glutamic-type intramembrane protease n=1 Tax=Saccharomonospora sp. NPDC046836 TaxID=3156921 RepID=UPI0033ECDA1D
MAALVLAHLGLPWALRALAAGRTGLLPTTVRRRPVAVYACATIVLGLLAVLASQDVRWLGPHPAVGLLAAVVIGVLLPLAVARLAGRPRRPFRRSARPGELITLAGSAAAEEVLWRFAALAVLRAMGLPLVAAAAVALVGFAVLHLPRGTTRQLPYHLLTGTILTALALTAGLVPAICCHIVHNVVLLTSPRRGLPPPKVTRPPSLPPTQGWNT